MEKNAKKQVSKPKKTKNFGNGDYTLRRCKVETTFDGSNYVVAVYVKGGDNV